MSRSYAVVLLALALAAAGGGYFQVYTGNVFICGLVESHPEAAGIAYLALGQAFLYLLQAGGSDRFGLYQKSQWAVLPVLLYGFFEAFRPYSQTTVFLLALLALPVLSALLLRQRAASSGGWLTSCGYFGTCFLGVYAAIGQIPLLGRGSVIGYPYIAVAVLGAVTLSLLALTHLRRADSMPRPPLPDFRTLLPLSVLLLPVLRAKFPDVAYDSYMYKTTLPMQIAEWRTGDMAIIDGFMVGTHLQELLNALLILVAPDYNPALISTFAFTLLFLVTPVAFAPPSVASPVARAIAAFAGLATFVLTEAAIDQGTSYQEPLMLLFLVAAMIRVPIWPLFVALAIMVKVNAVFVAPVLLLFHLSKYRSFWRSPRQLGVGCLVFAVALTPHLARNVIFSGRILGLNETLASVTDPPGPGAILAAGGTRYDELPRGGVLNNAVLSACNMLALNVLCPTEYDGTQNAGFHIFPASRSPLFGVIFLALALGLALLRREGRILALASAGTFVLSYIAVLAFLSEGRYFMPLGFAFGLLLLINLRQAEYAVSALGGSTAARAGTIALGCILIGSNLLPGVLTNVSWICNRNLLRPATTVDFRAPRTGLENFLADRVERYKQACPPPGLPPVILAELGSLDSPYLGAQRIFHTYTQEMIRRFFTADPSRRARAADAIIAVVAQSLDYPATTLGAALADFEQCFTEGTTRAWCSLRLAPATARCASSLYDAP